MLPQHMAVPPKAPQRYDESAKDGAEHAAAHADAEVGKQSVAEQRESSCDGRPDQIVRCEHRRCVLRVGHGKIDKQRLEE